MNRADVFVGFANYAELFADPIFIGALRNTFIIVVVSVPVTCAFSLWVSSAIVDLPEWTTSLFRCVFSRSTSAPSARGPCRACSPRKKDAPSPYAPK